MQVVSASRLVPFISFDAVSYAAGLSCLSFERFALATLLGFVPICFALATMGAGMVEGGPDWMLVVTMGGAITLLPILGKRVWDRVKAQDRLLRSQQCRRQRQRFSALKGRTVAEPAENIAGVLRTGPVEAGQGGRTRRQKRRSLGACVPANPRVRTQRCEPRKNV